MVFKQICQPCETWRRYVWHMPETLCCVSVNKWMLVSGWTRPMCKYNVCKYSYMYDMGGGGSRMRVNWISLEMDRRMALYLVTIYMKPELDVPINKEWQKTKSVTSVPDTFRSLPWSLQGRIVNKSSNIWKYLPGNRDHWWSVWSFWQNWCSTVKRISHAFLLHHNAINM